MPISTQLRHQDYQFQVNLASGSWRWTTRIDVSLAQLQTEIRDIISPYGLLRDSIPIPGEVVQAMAESIGQIQSAYQPSLLLGGLDSGQITFIVDEGRGFSSPVEVMVTNSGTLGSLLSATVTSSAGFVSATPANLGGLTANQSATFEVSVDSTNLTAGSTSALLTVQSTAAANSPQTIPVNITVRPKAVMATNVSARNFTVALPLSGPFPPIPAQSFLLENTGPSGSILDYQIKRLTGASWLSNISPTYGSINGGTATAITVLVYPASNMLPGVYTEILRISGYSTNLTLDVTITLTIT